MIEQASLIVGDGNWAVKSDSLLGYKIIDGKYYPREMSVVRATTGTRVNEAGLVELVPYNLVGYSEQFENTAWSKQNFGTTFTLTDNFTTAPNGTLTACKYTWTAMGSGQYFSVYQTNALPSSNQYTFSVYMKGAVGGEKLYIYNYPTYTTQLCTLTTEWQRFSITVTTNQPFFFIGGEFGQGGMTTLPAGTAYIWGGQLVEGSTALPYQKTETRLNIPRLDYSNGTCPSLLVEPQRTNLLQRSEEFDNAYWAKTNATITANSAISPSGIQNADTITSTAPSPNIVSSVVSFGSTTNVSIFVKYISQRWVQLMSGGAFNGFANFDIQNGVIGTVGSNASNAKIEDFGNGWYRISVNLLGFTGNTNLYFGFVASGTAAWNTFDPNFNKSIYAWGAQLEADSYATSYIPTTSASVTRNADVISKTGISSLIGQTEGVMFLDLNIPNVPQNTTYMILRDLSSSSYLGLRFYNGHLRFETAVSGVPITTIDYPMSAVGTFKIAMAYKLNDYAFYINGVQIGVETSAIVPTCNMLDLFFTIAPSNIVKINAAALWKTRLTNDQLASLTTL